MQRVGFVGTENSHVKHFIRFLNLDDRHPDYRAVALSGGASEHNTELASYGGLDLIVDEPADLVGHIDAAIVCNRDGGLHRGAAEPLLRGGIPVLVDKPLATTVEDAQALLGVAEESGSTLVSSSALRFVPEIAEFSGTGAERGSLRHLHLAGPADPDSEYAGLFFYGIHHVEAALEILGNPVLSADDLIVHAERHDGLVWATTTIGETVVTFTFKVPQHDGGRVPFHATAVYDRAIHTSELTLTSDYNAPSLDQFVDAIAGGGAQLSRGQLLSPVVLLTAVVEALAANR